MPVLAPPLMSNSLSLFTLITRRLEGNVLQFSGDLRKRRHQSPSGRLLPMGVLSKTGRAELDAGNIRADFSCRRTPPCLPRVARPALHRWWYQSDESSIRCVPLPSCLPIPEAAKADAIFAAGTLALEFGDRSLDEDLGADQFFLFARTRLFATRPLLARSCSLTTSFRVWRSMTTNCPLCISASVSWSAMPSTE